MPATAERFLSMLLAELPDGTDAYVERVVSRNPEIDDAALRRLAELGFIPGEPLRMLRRGPGGREPLAVMIGQTMFALRRVEAECIEVSSQAGSETTTTAARA